LQTTGLRPETVAGRDFQRGGRFSRFKSELEKNGIFRCGAVARFFAVRDPKSLLLSVARKGCRMIFLRAGVGNIQRIKTFRGTEEYSAQPNLGIGLRLGNFYLDYAITDIGNQSESLYSNIFSLKFLVNKGPGS
jgi:hypothetical protein